MTDTTAGVILLVLAVVVFNNYRRGTLGQWFASKFLGRGSEAGAGQQLIGLGTSTVTTADQVVDVAQAIEDEQVTATDLETWRGAVLHRSAMPSYKAMVLAAEADGITLVAGSTYRSRAAQEALRRAHGCGGARVYDRSCKGSPPTAVPGRSNHEKGLAVDFRNMRTRAEGGARYQWLVANAGRFGWKNLPSEAWHWSTGPRAGS